MEPLFRGIVIGFAIAAPVGPIGLLCITRTLSFGFRVGLATGLGAAVADAMYGLAAALGLSAIVLASHRVEQPLHLAGAAVLIILGLRTVFSRSAQSETTGNTRPSMRGALLTTFGLTAINPATILSFVAIVSAAGVSGNIPSAVLFVCGVFAGSLIWWGVLAGGVSLARAKITQRIGRIITVGGGVALAAMGVYLLL